MLVLEIAAGVLLGLGAFAIIVAALNTPRSDFVAAPPPPLFVVPQRLHWWLVGAIAVVVPVIIWLRH